VLNVDVELALVVVESEGRAMHADDIPDSVDDGQVFEPVGVQDDGCIVVSFDPVQAGVNHLERANKLALVDLVRERSIDNNTINVCL